MPKKQFILEENGRHTLELTWNSMWRNFTVHYDGAPVETIEGGGRGLRAGKTILLPDGSELDVRLKDSLMASELAVARNGRPLPGTATHPLYRIQQAYTIIFIIAGLNVILGLVGLVSTAEWVLLLSGGWITAVFGLFFLLLGWLVKAKHSLPALITAIVLYVADGLLGIATVLAAGEMPGVAGLIIRILFIIGMAQGIKAIREIDK
ncbi:MAG: hypothetical protein H6667_23820 [Ardenticatenaceae bacterium]|nr:hypothetical protein [Ardenticatenaceae bacterium]